MGSLRATGGGEPVLDWRSSLQFSVTNQSFPVELFISVMEREASTQKLDDLELVQYTMGFLDSNEFDPATLSSHQSSWADLKAFLIKEHGCQNVSLEQKVQLLKSVIKGPTENCQHYLIRAKYVAGLLKATLLTACQCPPALPSSYDDFVKILFLSGLEDYERDFCGVNKVGNLEVLAELLNLNIRTDGQDFDGGVGAAWRGRETTSAAAGVKAEEHCEVKVDPSSIKLERDVVDAVRTGPSNEQANNGGGEEDPDYVANYSEAEYDNDDYDSEDEPLSKRDVKEVKKEAHSGDDEEYKPVKKRVAVSKGPGRGRGPRGPRGASRSCKHCSEVFNRWDDWRDHEKECKLRPTSANKTCKYCGHVTKRVGQMRAHVKECKGFVKNETVTCQLCNEEVKRSKFKKHAKNMHKGNTMSCPTCGDHVRGENHLKRHIEQMHNHDRAQELAQYVAEGMVSEDKNAPKSDPLAQIEPIMLEERTKDRQIQTQCAGCKEIIVSASAFGNHVKEKHNGRRFFCDHCSYSSNKANCVYDHRLKLHNVLSGDHTLYKCLVESCTFKTIEHFSIITHVRQIHLRKDEFKCQVCSKVFYSQGTLKIHTEAVHMGIKRYPCPKCDIQCSDQRGLEYHMQTHLAAEDRQTYVCEECGGNFMNMFTLRSHVKRVHRGIKNKECPHCPGKMFYNTSLLKRHLRSVHQMEVDGKNYICEHCNRRFSNKYHLESHIQTAHLKIKSFKCKVCNTLFSKAVNLTYHIGVKHLGFTAELAKANRHLARAHEAYEVLATAYNPLSNNKDGKQRGKRGYRGRLPEEVYPRPGVIEPNNGSTNWGRISVMPQKEATSDIKVKEDPLDT